MNNSCYAAGASNAATLAVKASKASLRALP